MLIIAGGGILVSNRQMSTSIIREMLLSKLTLGETDGLALGPTTDQIRRDC